jgi:hypothetical protein
MLFEVSSKRAIWMSGRPSRDRAGARLTARTNKHATTRMRFEKIDDFIRNLLNAVIPRRIERVARAVVRRMS